jgi:hypothetical protein
VVAKKYDLINCKFGRLTVKKKDDEPRKRASIFWVCECECGNVRSIPTNKLISGWSKSCGCLQKEAASKANTKHGESRSTLYVRWKGIKARCHNPKNKYYDRYGGRGIKICD